MKTKHIYNYTSLHNLIDNEIASKEIAKLFQSEFFMQYTPTTRDSDGGILCNIVDRDVLEEYIIPDLLEVLGDPNTTQEYIHEYHLLLQAAEEVLSLMKANNISFSTF
jgi:hypothetical protein